MRYGITVSLRIQGQDQQIHFSEIEGDKVLVKFGDSVGVIKKEQLDLLEIFKEPQDAG